MEVEDPSGDPVKRACRVYDAAGIEYSTERQKVHTIKSIHTQQQNNNYHPRPAKRRLSACVSYRSIEALLTFTTSNLFVTSSQWNTRLIPAHLHHSKHLQHGLALPQPFFVILATYRSAPFTLGSRRRAAQPLAPPSSGTQHPSAAGDGKGLSRPELSLPLASPLPLPPPSLASEGGEAVFLRPSLPDRFSCFVCAFSFFVRLVTPGP